MVTTFLLLRAVGLAFLTIWEVLLNPNVRSANFFVTTLPLTSSLLLDGNNTLAKAGAEGYSDNAYADARWHWESFLLFEFVLRNFTEGVILDVLREVSFLLH